MAADRSPSMLEALSQYIARPKGKGQKDGQQELNRFIQWCGRDRSIDELTPPDIGGYAESAGMWGADSAEKLKPVKQFLTFLKDRGLISVSLASHLRASRAKRGQRRAFFRSATEHAELSAEGYAGLQSRLHMLKEERVKIVSDIGRAMADKDFKENAPLDAAKERQGLIESGIRDLEGILANAVVTTKDRTDTDKRVRIGKKVTLKDARSGKLVRYTLVDSQESDPLTGKISSISPVGRALMDKTIGEEVQITVPSGTLHYIVTKVER